MLLWIRDLCIVCLPSILAINLKEKSGNSNQRGVRPLKTRFLEDSFYAELPPPQLPIIV